MFFVLLLLNLLALAAGMGWLGSSSPRGEPERLTNQLNPQLIRLIDPRADEARVASVTDPAPTPTPRIPPNETVAPSAPVTAPPPPSQPSVPEAAPLLPPPVSPPMPAPDRWAGAAMVCSAIGGLSEALAAQIERIAQETGAPVETTRIRTESSSGWWVRIPPAASRQAADQRAQQLRELGVTDLFVVRETGPDQHTISLGLFRTEAAARQHLADLQRLRVNGAEVTARAPERYRLEITAPSEVLDDIYLSLPAAVRQSSREECRQ